ncbi:uncharacterized protein FOMMEDRAFT_150635 [Fomitiporia mediterranea MF3/22]|uniref:uncharacterized protein n=1 Tax=Fomitiporia mediterranea (strain MF3/22) TaxID=694068 RepID=UPI0004409C33|nr:uncharacterized protein FOMMEDRAFT_150635 [Fomitiporia mediterranea MF3/22]EJD08000.1 hypothetical protein FOMMEDRAFT_150635 [Fomitiporia mediterranea MF3/22]
MPSEFFKNPMHSRTSSCSTVQATIDEHTLATMSMYVYSHCATPSLTRPTLYAFAFLRAGHDTTLNRSSGPLLTPIQDELNPSTSSTSPSPFEPERPRDTPFQSMQHALTDTASLATQISSFNTLDLNPGAPLTLAARRRGVSIFLLQAPALANNPLPPQQVNLQIRLTSVTSTSAIRTISQSTHNPTCRD